MRTTADIDANIATNAAATGSVARRLFYGFCASALGPVVTAVFQVLSVPLFLHYWGAKLYGEWLILSAIPSYLALSDVGFGTVAANHMTMRVGAGDRSGALETFQSTWIFVTVVSIATAIAVGLAVVLVPTAWFFRGGGMPINQVRASLVLLSVYALVSLQSTLIQAGYRCEGRFASGMLFINASRLAETLAVFGVVLCRATPVLVAGAYLGIRVAATILFATRMLRATPWIRYGVRHATWDSIQRLAGPALAFMAIPAANAISLQGLVIAIGWMLGPVPVAVFSTMRTLTRFPVQLVEAVKSSFWPELSSAYGARNWIRARKLHRCACQAAVVLSALATVFLLAVGPRIFTAWTHGRLRLDMATFQILVAVVFCNSFWNASSIVTLATNTHQRFALVYLSIAVISVALAVVGVSRAGLAGAAASLLVTDLGLGWYVVRLSLMALGESPADFVRALGKVELPSPAKGVARTVASFTRQRSAQLLGRIG